MSNGSDEIVWRNRHTFAVEKRIQVYGNMESVVQLNELELIDGKLIANIYTDKRLVEFDTTSGKVISFIDCSALVIGQPVGVDYLNGIAHDPVSGKIVITGKLWPSLYEVSFK
jgi:glutaminyl-peptide cyclotransferase